MRIGYACLTVGVPETKMKHSLIKNANQKRLHQLIEHNLKSLENIIDYNIKEGIKLFRISSDLIPFGSNPVNDIEWWDLYEKEFNIIGSKIRNNGIRVSMHPGQYTVLNSIDDGVVDRAIQDLEYHEKILSCLKTGKEHKIVLHIGGVYKDKKLSIERFMTNYHKLSESIKNRLVIENDDKSYNTAEVLEIGMQLNIPVIFDNLHHQVNPPGLDLVRSESFWINECNYTWKKQDGKQKIHYSQQNFEKKAGSHSNTIRINEFIEFYSKIERQNIDIMLEVKDKNLSAIKCINCTSKNKAIKLLELEWSRYKYNVLEKSQASYIEIRKLLKNKNEYPAVSFYNILENALYLPETEGTATNSLQHVWGYFKELASSSEKEEFLAIIENYRKGAANLSNIKRFLFKLAIKYEQQYLLDSYYFIL